MTSPSLECMLVVGLVICAVMAHIPTRNIADAVLWAGDNQAARRDRNRQRLEDGTYRLSGGRPKDLLQQFHGRRPKSREISNIAHQVLDKTQNLLDKGFTIANVTSDSTVAVVQETLMLIRVCGPPTVYNCNPSSPYRTVDGFCSNLDNAKWGKSFVAQRRVIGPAYETGSVGVTGRPLPNPRTVSNVVHSNRNGVTINGFNLSTHVPNGPISRP